MGYRDRIMMEKCANRIAESNRRLGADIVESSAKHDAAIKEISDKEIEARDRVDISLKEYMSMREELERLRHERDNLEGFMRNLCDGLSLVGESVCALDHIIPNTFDVYTNTDILTYRKRYRVEFEVDLYNTRKVGR